MTDRELLKLAAHHLDPDLFVVWLQKHYQHIGRRAGSRQLQISQEQWRYRLAKAERIIAGELETRKEPAA